MQSAMRLSGDLGRELLGIAAAGSTGIGALVDQARGAVGQEPRASEIEMVAASTSFQRTP